MVLILSGPIEMEDADLAVVSPTLLTPDLESLGTQFGLLAINFIARMLLLLDNWFCQTSEEIC